MRRSARPAYARAHPYTDKQNIILNVQFYLDLLLLFSLPLFLSLCLFPLFISSTYSDKIYMHCLQFADALSTDAIVINNWLKHTEFDLKKNPIESYDCAQRESV